MCPFSPTVWILFRKCDIVSLRCAFVLDIILALSLNPSSSSPVTSWSNSWFVSSIAPLPETEITELTFKSSLVEEYGGGFNEVLEPGHGTNYQGKSHEWKIGSLLPESQSDVKLTAVVSAFAHWEYGICKYRGASMTVLCLNFNTVGREICLIKYWLSRHKK